MGTNHGASFLKLGLNKFFQIGLLNLYFSLDRMILACIFN
jgi:hypothetical protein